MENTDEQEIQINEFLKFLKTSCHVNDLIRDSKESMNLLQIKLSKIFMDLVRV